MTFETEPERWALVAVLILRASSCIGKPGIDVPKGTFSPTSNKGEGGALL